MDLVREIHYLKPELIVKHWLNFFYMEVTEENTSKYSCTSSLPVSKSQEILKRNINDKEKAMKELLIKEVNYANK
jgi:hypothetical protein